MEAGENDLNDWNVLNFAADDTEDALTLPRQGG
jgi:hypothetical protein